MIRCIVCFMLFALLVACAQPLKAVQDASEKVAAESAGKDGQYRGQYLSVSMDQPESANRAWETRPYQVATWICHDGSPLIKRNETEICDRIAEACQLIDPSGWNVRVGTPPSQWRWKLLEAGFDDQTIESLLSDPELQHYDKLLVVRIDDKAGNLTIDVREIDVRTRQVGPKTMAQTRLPASIAPLSAKLIRRSFMPIARIDDVFRDKTLQMRARGIEICQRTQINEDLIHEVVTNRSSPCFVKETDRLLPVVIRTDRSGNVTQLDAVPFTFVAISEIDGTLIDGKLYSTVNAPLAGRKSKYAEKLALVIRPGDGETTLRLVSRGDDNPEPLEGYDVVTVNPDDIKEELEYHGKTDWRGEIQIPRCQDMRMLLVRRGGRRLKRIPVIPGFREELETSVTSDETRLLASGVVDGLSNEVVSLAVLRRIYQKQIEQAIKDKKKDDARQILRTYAALESPQDLRTRMAGEEIRLKSQTDSPREKEVIQRMFEPLKKIVSSSFIRDRETEIQKWIEAGEVPVNATDESEDAASETSTSENSSPKQVGTGEEAEKSESTQAGT